MGPDRSDCRLFRWVYPPSLPAQPRWHFPSSPTDGLSVAGVRMASHLVSPQDLPTHRCFVDMHRGTHHKGPRRCSGGVQRRAPWPAAWSSQRALHGQRVHERAGGSPHTSAIRTHHVQRTGKDGCACPPCNIVYLAKVAHHPTKVRIRVDGLERRVEGLVRCEVGAHV